MMMRLHKILRTAGYSIEEMFKKLIRGLGTTKSEFLAVEEFLAVLQSVGYKDILNERENFARIMESLPKN